MFYYLYQLLKDWDIPGLGMFQYISFRSGAAIIISLLITVGFGKSLIHLLQKKQIGEEVRDLGLEGQMQKKGTPTTVSYTHLRAHETRHDLVCRLLLEKKKQK